ncbi:MAG: glutamine amidotransferase [Armatimonadota bacterium]
MRTPTSIFSCLIALLLLCGSAYAADRIIHFEQLNIPAKGSRVEEGGKSYILVPTLETSGRVISGEERVEPGRYMLTLALATPPFGTKTAQLDCILDATGQLQRRRVLSGPDFPADGTPLTVAWDLVVTTTSTVRVTVEWSNNPLLTNTKTTPKPAEEPGEKGGLDEAVPPPPRELATVRIYDIALTRLDNGMALARVFPNKLLYRRNEPGTVAVTVRNFTAAEQTGMLTLVLIQDLQATRMLTPVEVTVPANSERGVNLLFTADNREYGCEARVILAQGKTVQDTRSDVFNVCDNVWNVALGAGGLSVGSMSGYCSEGSLANDVRICREQYFNWWEKMFWPPDDWGDMTPEREEWISGQSARWEKSSNIKAFIAAAKPQGIKSVSYAKNSAGGPESWELARKHPDWFYTDESGHFAGSFNTWDLANWHDVKLHTDREGRKKFSADWWGVMPDLRQPTVLEWGIKEILESSKSYGWDGMRFDGHFTAGNDELSTANMRRLKDVLWGYDPNFRFGFNMSWSYGYQTSFSLGGMHSGYDHELRELMAGGGMYMQEAINHWAYSYGGNQVYTSWKDFGVKEVTAANGVRKLGGSYHFIYAIRSLNPVARLYKFALGTAAGVHPVYGDTPFVPGCENWGRFLTRWSAFVWDAHLQPVPPGAVEVITPQPLWWQEWVKERVADAKTRHLIIHLINPPTADTIKQEALLSAPVTNITVKVKVPKGQTFTRAMLLNPLTGVTAQELSAKIKGEWAEIVVSRVDSWALVVAEFAGAFTLPAEMPRYSEPPDPVKVAAARQGAGVAPGSDPMRPEATLAKKVTTEWVYETDTGYNSCPARGISDTDALNGVAQVRDAGETSAYVGRSWLGPFSPGKYTASLRIKLEDKADPPRAQSAMMVLYQYPNGKGEATNNYFATADARLPENRTLIVDGKYHDYEIPFEIKVGMPISIIGGINTKEKGDHRFLLDRIVIKQIEAYTDTKLAEMNPLVAPEGLQPGGAPGLDILVAKGWTWEAYQLDQVLPALAGGDRVASLWSDTGEIIGFPQKHEDLYKYNVVMLTNVSAFGMNYQGRKVLRDFIQAGGGLVILGGAYTLGQGSFADTFMDDLLPVQVSGVKEVVHADKPLILAPGNSSLLQGIDATTWKKQPAVYWLHQVKPKPEATIHLTAGGQPVLITGNFGKGRIAVFTGTVMGKAQGQETPCWQWSGWPTLLANTVRWASSK